MKPQYNPLALRFKGHSFGPFCTSLISCKACVRPQSSSVPRNLSKVVSEQSPHRLMNPSGSPCTGQCLTCHRPNSLEPAKEARCRHRDTCSINTTHSSQSQSVGSSQSITEVTRSNPVVMLDRYQVWPLPSIVSYPCWLIC